jgi:hypothetical protein
MCKCSTMVVHSKRSLYQALAKVCALWEAYYCDSRVSGAEENRHSDVDGCLLCLGEPLTTTNSNLRSRI